MSHSQSLGYIIHSAALACYVKEPVQVPPHVPSRLTRLNKFLLLFDLEFTNVVEVDKAHECDLRMGGLESGG